MTDAKRQLTSLLRIQELAIEIQNARAIVEGAPGKIEEAEARFRERNAEYVALKERFEAIEADRRARTLELETLEDSKVKFQDSLMQVKNQREYAAVLKEIDTVKAQIGEHEDVILKSMDEVSALKLDLDGRAAHIETERTIVDNERTEVEAAVADAEQRITTAMAARESIEAGLPEHLVANMKRVEEGRRGIFLVRADRETCTACHVRIRPQVYQEIRLTTRIHTCGNCKRYLYYEPALQSDSAPTTSADGPGASLSV
jgi:uncharacterized protein